MEISARTSGYLKWAACNIPMYALALLGTLGSQAWAFNLFAFLVFIFGGLYTVTYLGILAAKATNTELPLPQIYYPRIIDRILDVTALLLVVGLGHWFVGILCTWYIFMGIVVVGECDKYHASKAS